MGKDITLYRRPGCMFCQQVEDLLMDSKIPHRCIEVTERDEQEALSRKHGAMSFPLVTVDGRYIGGFTHIVQLHSQGRLGELTGASGRGARASEGYVAVEKAESKPAPGSLASWASLGKLMRERGRSG